jgi:hypothetical protein
LLNFARKTIGMSERGEGFPWLFDRDYNDRRFREEDAMTVRSISTWLQLCLLDAASVNFDQTLTDSFGARL